MHPPSLICPLQKSRKRAHLEAVEDIREGRSLDADAMDFLTKPPLLGGQVLRVIQNTLPFKNGVLLHFLQVAHHLPYPPFKDVTIMPDSPQVRGKIITIRIIARHNKERF